MRKATLTSKSSLSLPQNSYIYKIQPHNAHLAAISSDDSLRLIDPNTLQETPNGVLQNIHEGVTCLESSTDASSSLWTAGRDGAVRQWDLRTCGKANEFRDDSKTAYLSLCHTTHGPAVGTELTNSQASILIWDIRNPTHPQITYPNSHNDDITVVTPHPHLPSTLLSASTDGLINIYTLNDPSPDPDDALTQITNHAHSIHRAGFLPPGGAQMFALSHDEDFSIYPVEESGEAEGVGVGVPTLGGGKAWGDLRGVLGCEYVIDVLSSFNGGGGGRGEGEVVLGAGSHSEGWMDLVPLRVVGKEWEFDVQGRVRLSGAHGEEIVRSFCFGVGGEVVWTAGEDGMVRAWRMDAEGGEMEADKGEEEVERKGKKKRRREKLDDGGKGRFKPY